MNGKPCVLTLRALQKLLNNNSHYSRPYNWLKWFAGAWRINQTSSKCWQSQCQSILKDYLLVLPVTALNDSGGYFLLLAQWASLQRERETGCLRSGQHLGDAHYALHLQDNESDREKTPFSLNRSWCWESRRLWAHAASLASWWVFVETHYRQPQEATITLYNKPGHALVKPPYPCWSCRDWLLCACVSMNS